MGLWKNINSGKKYTVSVEESIRLATQVEKDIRSKSVLEFTIPWLCTTNVQLCKLWGVESTAMGHLSELYIIGNFAPGSQNLTESQPCGRSEPDFIFGEVLLVESVKSSILKNAKSNDGPIFRFIKFFNIGQSLCTTMYIIVNSTTL